jgi:hypothetical protein
MSIYQENQFKEQQTLKRQSGVQAILKTNVYGHADLMENMILEHDHLEDQEGIGRIILNQLQEIQL